MPFQNRVEAGQRLAERLLSYKEKSGTVVIGLPRGGVIVAFEVANALKLPMDIIVPRKIGAPGNRELAIGAITEEGVGIFDKELIQTYGISEDYIKEEVAREKEVAHRRLQLYRVGKPPVDLKEKQVLLIDDGVATGATMRASIVSVKARGVKSVVVAVPVAPPQTVKQLKLEADEVVVVEMPDRFRAVGEFYEDFAQTEDQEIVALLKSKSDEVE